MITNMEFLKNNFSEEFINKAREIYQHCDENKIPSVFILNRLIDELNSLNEFDFSPCKEMMDSIREDITQKYLGRKPINSTFLESPDQDIWICPLDKQNNGGVGVFRLKKDYIATTLAHLQNNFILKDKEESADEDIITFAIKYENNSLPGKLYTGLSYKGKKFFIAIKFYPLFSVMAALLADLEHFEVKYKE